MKGRNSRPKLHNIIILFILLFPTNLFEIVNAQNTSKYPDDEYITSSSSVMAVKDNFQVTWFMLQEMPYIFNITVENIGDIKRTLELSMLFSDMDLDKLHDVSFYEWKNISHEVSYDTYSWYLNETGHNLTYTSGQYFENEYWFDWKPSKANFFNKNDDELKENYGEINIGKNETKTFQLKFSTPIGFKNFGRVALQLGDALFDPWFDPDWSNRKTHNITGSTAGAQTDYPVQIWVVRASGTDSGDHVFLGTTPQADFGDIRFTNSSGEDLIDQWLEFRNATHSSWWVELPTIPASPNNVTIYIYYGNAGAAEVSNGTAVFTVYEDGEDISDWDRTSTRVTVDNGRFKALSSGVYGDAELRSITFPTTYAIDYEMNITASGGTSNIHVGSMDLAGAAWNDENDGVFSENHFSTPEFRLQIRENTVRTTIEKIDYDLNTLYYLRIIRNATSAELVVFNDQWNSVNGSLDVTYTPVDLPNRLFISVRDQVGATAFIDDIRVRKFAVPEPTHSVWGAEETAAPDAPTLVFPIAAAEILTSTNQLFTWLFNGVSEDFNQSAYQIQIFNTTSDTVFNDSGKTVSGNLNATITLPSTPTSMSWRVKTWDDFDNEGLFSDNRTFTVAGVITISVTISNIEGGNYIFASNVYLFAAEYQGGNDTFQVAFDDGITFINMSYNRPSLSFALDSGTGFVNLLSVIFSETENNQTVTFRVFILDSINDVLDRDIHMRVNNTGGQFAGWDERRTDFLNIYNKGGLTESLFAGDAGLVAGGNIFSIAAQNSTLGSYGRVNVTWRKFQHLSLLTHVFQATAFDSGHWECPTEHSDTATIIYGVDYSLGGTFIDGWQVRIFVADGSARSTGTDQAWVKLNVSWYNRGLFVKSDFIYAYYEAHLITDGNTQFALWVDLWVDIAEGSSTVGGRVNPVFFGMSETGWGPWSSWAPIANSSSVSLFHDDLLDSTSSVISSSQIDLFNVWVSLNKTAEGALTPSDDEHQWALIDYDIFTWSILGATQTMIGIDTPTPNFPRTPDIGAPGLFSSLTLAIALMTKQIVNAILQGATVTSFAIASIIDSAFGFFGVQNFIGLMTDSLTQLATHFQLAITNVTSLILILYTFISSSILWFGSALSAFVGFWVTLGNIAFQVTTGTFGGIDIWSIFNWELIIGSGFAPLVITYFWWMTIDDRSKRQGGNWITILWGDLSIILGMTSFFIDAFFTLINFTVNSIFQIMNALDIAARRIFGG